MIYDNEQSARAWAAELNKRQGYPPAYAVLTTQGWTVVATYRAVAQSLGPTMALA